MARQRQQRRRHLQTRHLAKANQGPGPEIVVEDVWHDDARNRAPFGISDPDFRLWHAGCRRRPLRGCSAGGLPGAARLPSVQRGVGVLSSPWTGTGRRHRQAASRPPYLPLACLTDPTPSALLAVCLGTRGGQLPAPDLETWKLAGHPRKGRAGGQSTVGNNRHSCLLGDAVAPWCSAEYRCESEGTAHDQIWAGPWLWKEAGREAWGRHRTQTRAGVSAALPSCAQG